MELVLTADDTDSAEDGRQRTEDRRQMSAVRG